MKWYNSVVYFRYSWEVTDETILASVAKWWSKVMGPRGFVILVSVFLCLLKNLHLSFFVCLKKEWMVWVPRNLLFCSATTFLPREISFLDVKSFPNVLIQVRLKCLLWWSLTWTILSPLPHSPLLTDLVTFHKEAHCPSYPSSTVCISFHSLARNLSITFVSFFPPSSSIPGSQWYCMWTWSSHQCLPDPQFHYLSKVIGGILSVMIFLYFLSQKLSYPMPNMLGYLSVRRASSLL